MAKFFDEFIDAPSSASSSFHQEFHRNHLLTLVSIIITLMTLFLFGSIYLSATIKTTENFISPSTQILHPSRTFIPIELSASADGSHFLSSNDRQTLIRNVVVDDEDEDIMTYLEEDGSLTTYNKTTYNRNDEEDLDHQNVSMKQHHSHKRIKRGVLGLASMIKCIARCNPLSYKDYGCYCGFQGEGYPVDPIDRCCYMHDLCYTRTECNQALVYFVSYKWICHKNRRASCGYVIDGTSKQLCAYQLCECDRKFAKCLSRHRCPKRKPSCRTKRNTILSLTKLLAF